MAALPQVERQLPAWEITLHLRLGKAVVGHAVCQACLSLVPFPCHLLLATVEKVRMAQLSLSSNKANSLLFAVLNPNAHHICIAAEHVTAVSGVGFFFFFSLAFPL